MEFAFGFRHSQRRFRLSFLTFDPISIISLPRQCEVQPRDWAKQRDASNRRRQVLKEIITGVGGVIAMRAM